MDLNPPALIATAVASSVIAIVAYVRAGDRPPNRLFAFNALWITLWALLTYELVTTRDEARAILLLRLLHPVSAAAMASFVDFVWVFPERFQPMPWRRRAALYASAVVFGGIASHPGLVRGITLTPAGPEVRFGWPLLVLAPYLGFAIIHVNQVLWHKLHTQQGIRRVQTVYVFAGTMVFEVFVFIADVASPIITGHTNYSKWGVVGYLFTAVAIAIAIAKHRLWDLSSLTRRIAAGVLAVGSLGLTAAVGVAAVGRWIPAVGRDPLLLMAGCLTAGAALGVALPGVYNAFRGLLMRSLTEERERISGLLSGLGSAIVHAPLGDAALAPMLKEVAEFFEATAVTAYLRRADGRFHDSGRAVAARESDASAPPRVHETLPDAVVTVLELEALTEPLDVGQIARFEALGDAVRKLEAMETLDASVVVPVIWEGETMGVLVFGPKISRDIYGASDIALLRSVAAHAAIALKTAQLRAEIITEKERTEKVFSEMESGVLAADAQGVVRMANPAACRLLSRREAQLIGADVSVLPGALGQLLRAALRHGSTVSGARSAVGQLPLACSTFVLRGLGGNIEGGGVIFRDLRTEDALRRVERETERLRFIRAVSAGMAHEIRNPLVAIRTFAELAPARLDDPEFRDSFLQVAREEVSRLEALVGQFMDLAKPARTVRVPTDLADLARNVARTVSARAQSENISITVEVPDDLPQPRADEPRLHQALANLVHNALDATPPGEVISIIGGVERDESGQEVGVTLTVWNAGSYITPEDRERVFEPFFTGKPTGTGLGLAICHTIVDEHGGTTTVESDPETGTAFTIHLPLVPASGPVLAAAK